MAAGVQVRGTILLGTAHATDFFKGVLPDQFEATVREAAGFVKSL